tara:strand:+ start:226 stop:810 length:585 start_codon:yes stop_codon:yes gene_type:complete
VDQALKRPDNFLKLTEEEQWSIDRKLGILDWDPTKEEIKEYAQRLHQQKEIELDKMSFEELIRHAEEHFRLFADDPSVKEWLDSRPEKVRLALEGLTYASFYRIKEGAPYRVSKAGTVGVVRGANEAGEIIFLCFLTDVEADQVLHDANEARKSRGLPLHGDTYPRTMQVHIDKQWIEPITITDILGGDDGSDE